MAAFLDIFSLNAFARGESCRIPPGECYLAKTRLLEWKLRGAAFCLFDTICDRRRDGHAMSSMTITMRYAELCYADALQKAVKTQRRLSVVFVMYS